MSDSDIMRQLFWLSDRREFDYLHQTCDFSRVFNQGDDFLWVFSGIAYKLEKKSTIKIPKKAVYSFQKSHYSTFHSKLLPSLPFPHHTFQHNKARQVGIHVLYKILPRVGLMAFCIFTYSLSFPIPNTV